MQQVPAKPRQVRKEAAVGMFIWVISISRLGGSLFFRSQTERRIEPLLVRSSNGCFIREVEAAHGCLGS
jgi:hypothetical protein